MYTLGNFCHISEFPTAAEGFSIVTVNQQLMCESHYKVCIFTCH